VEGIVRGAARRCGVTGRDRYRGRSLPEAPEAEGRTEGRDGTAGRVEGAEGEQLHLL
jgi:hypothetical protein